MSNSKILIVENDGIVSMDIKNRLKRFGYIVCGTASSGEEAVKKTEKVKPDLVLMDVVLKGEMGGIKAAEIIQSRFKAPVIFLTAYADEERFERAKTIAPFGYIIKPFRDRELKITIEMALYKARIDAERRQDEKTLKESEEKYRVLFNSASDAVLLLDVETLCILDGNEAATALYGYSHSELLKMKVTDLSSETKKTKDVIQKNFAVSIPLRYQKKKDGTIFPVEIRANYFQLNNRKTNISNIRDISERIKTEKEKNEMKTRLHQAQRLESLGTLAGGIAHDFNNILASILGYSEIALSQIKKGSQLEDDLKEIYKAGDRAKELIHQILTIARKTDDNIYSIKVSLIAKETIKLIRASIPTTINIKQEINSDSKVIANPTSIHQIFMNLLTNAAQAMEKSGGILTVSINDCDIKANTSIDFKGLGPGKYIQISVADTGTGISPENILSVFEPYFTTKNQREGTGLGLAVVDGAVKGMGGEIFVKSKTGEGTVFTIYLPVTQVNKKKLELKDYKDVPKGNEHILFVDDELAIARVGKRMLEKLGYTITKETNSVEALELFRENPNKFHLVITDMTMPKMTGEQLSHEIMKINPKTPVIICTGFSKNFSEKDAYKMGISAFCYKPLDIKQLAETIRRVLGEN